MKISVFVQKLIEQRINTNLLIEFYEEVAETEKLFNSLVKDIVDPNEHEETKVSIAAIERFCLVLRELQIRYSALEDDLAFASETLKREKMIANAERFVALLEKDCNIKLPDKLY